MKITTSELVARRDAGEKYAILLSPGIKIIDLGVKVVRNEMVPIKGTSMQVNRRTIKLRYDCCGAVESVRSDSLMRNIRYEKKIMRCTGCRKNAKKGEPKTGDKTIGSRHIEAMESASFTQRMHAMMPARPYDRSRL